MLVLNTYTSGLPKFHLNEQPEDNIPLGVISM